MPDISQLPHKLNTKKRECQVVIETPKGRRNKFKYEPDSGLFSLSRVLPQGFTFPFDFGFVPSTIAEDGDPLDVVVLMDEPAHVGCLLEVRLIGVVQLVQSEEGKRTENDRIIGVTKQSFQYEGVNSIDDLKESTVKQMGDFLALYNKDSEQRDEVTGIAGPDRAVELVQKAIEAFEEKNRKSSANPSG